MRTVPCYSLLDFLAPGDIENLKPHLRTTFTETWRSIGDGTGEDVGGLINTIENIASVEYRCDNWDDSALAWAQHGRRIEEALYLLAVERGLTIIPGPPRNRT